MIQTVIVAIPGLIALIECIRRGPERAFLNVYLPVLLLVPEHSWPISGQFTFVDTAILPIAAFLLFQPKQRWKWSSVDFLVIAYLAIMIVAEGMNKGYKLGSQNLAIQESVAILLPYFAARHMFRHPQFAFDFAKRVVVLLTIVAILSIYEFRMSSDLFTKPFEGIFPSIFTVVFRAGFLRTQGPYGHAITLGLMMVLGFRVARWLEWNGVWKDRIPFLLMSRIRFCELWIIAGSMMALSVGPWLAAACGSLVIAICRAKNRKPALVSLALVIALLGGPTYTAFVNYVSVDPLAAYAAGDRLQQDSAYRNMLLPLYIPVVEERPTWGWGRNGWPVLHRMWSIDNAYLFTALTFGLYALFFQVALFVLPPIRLIFYSYPLRRTDPRALAAYTMISIYVINLVIDATAAGGGAPWIFVLIIAGWNTALLTGARAEAPEIEAVRVVTPQQKQVAFRRVMA